MRAGPTPTTRRVAARCSTAKLSSALPDSGTTRGSAVCDAACAVPSGYGRLSRRRRGEDPAMTRRFVTQPLALALFVSSALMSPVVGLAAHDTIPTKPLEAYSKLDPSGVTVSGISSGAFFAHQFFRSREGCRHGRWWPLWVR